MRAVGIICEYNPFHNGHAYQIRAAKELSGCEAAVCVMSGAFVQRGEAAVFDKFVRARAAIENGADLVVELPVWYVLQAAPVFAEGGIGILQKSSLANAVSFGSECGNAELLKRCAALLCDEPDDLKCAIARFTDAGLSYPVALTTALEELYPNEAKAIKSPNDMLGVNYICAMMKNGFNAEIFPVKRHVAPHGTDITDGRVASSSAIRKMIYEKKDVSALLPVPIDAPVHSTERLETLILGFYRAVSPSRTANLPGAERGFENRLASAAKKACDLNEFYNLLTSKRYTLSRVKRLALAGILGLEKNKACDYVRILGMTAKGARLLKERKEKTLLPFVTKTADFSPAENSTFPYDIAASDIAALACVDKGEKNGGADFYVSPFVAN